MQKNIIFNIVGVSALFCLSGGLEQSNYIEIPSFKEETVRVERVQIQGQDQGVFLVNLKSGTPVAFLAFFLSS